VKGRVGDYGRRIDAGLEAPFCGLKSLYSEPKHLF
jgi:hypothetical protein